MIQDFREQVNPALTAGMLSGFNSLGQGIADYFGPNAVLKRQEADQQLMELAIKGFPEAIEALKKKGVRVFYKKTVDPNNPNVPKLEFQQVPKDFPQAAIYPTFKDWDEFDLSQGIQQVNREIDFDKQMQGGQTIASAPTRQAPSGLQDPMLKQRSFGELLASLFPGGTPIYDSGQKAGKSKDHEVAVIRKDEWVMPPGVNQIPGAKELLSALLTAGRKMPVYDEGKAPPYEIATQKAYLEQQASKKSNDEINRAQIEKYKQQFGPYFDELLAAFISERETRRDELPIFRGVKELGARGEHLLTFPHEIDAFVRFLEAQEPGRLQKGQNLPDPVTAGKVLAQMPQVHPGYPKPVKGGQPFNEGSIAPGTTGTAKYQGYPGNLAQFQPSGMGKVEPKVEPKIEPKVEPKPKVEKQPIVTKKEEKKVDGGMNVGFTRPTQAVSYRSDLAGGGGLNPADVASGKLSLSDYISSEMIRGIPVSEVGGRSSAQLQNEKIATAISLATGAEQAVALRIANEFAGDKEIIKLRKDLLKAQTASAQSRLSISSNPRAFTQNQLDNARIDQIEAEHAFKLLETMRKQVADGKMKQVQFERALIPTMLKNNPGLIMSIPTGANGKPDYIALRAALGIPKPGDWFVDTISDEELDRFVQQAYEAYMTKQQRLMMTGNGTFTGMSYQEGSQALNEIEAE